MSFAPRQLRDELLELVVGQVTLSLRAIDDESVLAADTGVIVVHGFGSARPYSSAIKHQASGQLYVVEGARGPLGGYSLTQDDFASIGYQHLELVPADIFARGVEPAAELTPEAFLPQSRKLEAVPADALLLAGDGVEVVTLHRKRFARLTLSADLAQQRLQAAKKAEAERLAAERLEEAEAEKAALREGAALLAKRRRWQEQQRWLADLPELLKPDALVLDMREANPCVQKVQYADVRRIGDKYVFDCKKLPTWGAVVSRSGQDVSKLLLKGPDYRTGVFNIARPSDYEFFAHYEGPNVALGTRVIRPQCNEAKFEAFRPAFGDLIVAHISIVGLGYEKNVDDQFTVSLASEFLQVRAPFRSISISRAIDEETADDNLEDGEEPERARHSDRVKQSVQDRYPEYHESHFEGRDWPWHWVKWQSSDNKLITEEMLRRRKRNSDWDKQKALLSLIFDSLGARRVTFHPDDEFLDAGISVEIALSGGDLDRIEEFLKKQNCEVRIFSLEKLPTADFLSVHTLDAERLERVIGRWKAANGSPKILKGMMADLIGKRSGTTFAVEGMLPVGQVGLLAGPAKLGKSVTGHIIAFCIAAGATFAGLSVHQGTVVILSGEDPTEAIETRRRRAAARLNLTTENLIVIAASEYNFSLRAALEDFEESIPDLRLLIVDSAATFVPDTNNGGAVREQLMNPLLAFTSGTERTALVIHHVSKEMTPNKARSAKAVIDKLKGSAELSYAARFTLTLHLESDSQDEQIALQTGLRCLTLYHRNNISEDTPRLLKSLRLKMDYSTGLLDCVEPPVLGLPQPDTGELKEARITSKELSGGMGSDLDNDARLAAPVIRRLEAEMGRRLPFAGAKSLYRLKGRGELEGWSRVRCERAHRRAVELGLCRIA